MPMCRCRMRHRGSEALKLRCGINCLDILREASMTRIEGHARWLCGDAGIAIRGEAATARRRGGNVTTETSRQLSKIFDICTNMLGVCLKRSMAHDSPPIKLTSSSRQRPLHAEEASLHIRRILNLLDPYRIHASVPSRDCLPMCEVKGQTPC
jgi:hypothetical protein